MPRAYDNEDAIGIFDSGVGGLTVVRQIAERLPHERLVYLGDTARLPYGTKSPETVVRYALGCAGILSKRGVKLVVVACNTASAHALDVLRDSLDVPVVGVVEPGARTAVRMTENKRIGVIGTRGTIVSQEYQRALQELSPDVEVFSQACPLFVPLAEEGWVDGDVPRRIAEAYLVELIEQNIDTLVLGCTHYPLLKGVIASVLAPGTRLVDSAESTSEVVREILTAMDMHASEGAEGQLDCLVSDAPERFVETGRAFWGKNIANVEWVDF